MFAAAAAATTAFQVKPCGKDKVAVFVNVVIDSLNMFTFCREVFGNAFLGIFWRDGLQILADLFLNGNFQADRAATILTEIKRYYRRIFIAPTTLVGTFRSAIKAGSANRTDFRLHKVHRRCCQAVRSASTGSLAFASSNAPNITVPYVTVPRKKFFRNGSAR